MDRVKILNFIKRKNHAAGNMFFCAFIKFFYKNKIKFVKVDFGKKFEFDLQSGPCSVNIGKNVTFRKNGIIRVRNNADLSIGNNSFFNAGISINCYGKILIGDNCMFGEDVKLYDHNHKFRDKNSPIIKQGFSIGCITIGNNCWIGSGVVILKNVTIGDNVIIGANCTISADIPSGVIVKNTDEFKHIAF